MTQVTLSAAEIVLGAMAGVMRQVENIGKGRQSAHGDTGQQDWQLHVEGCLGEMALAKYLNLYWHGKGRLRDFDVGGRVDVRTAAMPSHNLILHPQDEDDRAFWLLTGRHGSYEVRGWIWGHDGKSQCYWRDPGTGRPAYFVSPSELRSPEDATWRDLGADP